MGGVMQMIRARQMGVPVYANSPDPTLGGLTPGIYPGTVLDPARGGENRLNMSIQGNGGTTALVILGVVVLALVGFNVSTRAFQA